MEQFMEMLQAAYDLIFVRIGIGPIIAILIGTVVIEAIAGWAMDMWDEWRNGR